MKIALVLFPIASEGGLATRVLHTVRLLSSFGHDVTFFRIRYTDVLHRGGNGVLKVLPKGDSITVQQYNLAITAKNIADTIAVLNGFDTIIFAHPCPHLSDKQYNVGNWPLLYEETRARKLVYFSDVYLDQFYPHILGVKKHFVPLAINEAVLRYLQPWLPDVRLARAPFFHSLEHPVGGGGGRTTDVLWTPAWRSWKGINRLVQALPQLTQTLKVETYGAGREMRNARKQMPKLWSLKNLTIHGTQPAEQVEAAYARSKLSLDLTGASEKYYGHVNRTHLEPMWAGCVSGLLPTMLQPHSAIPPECALVLDKNDLAGSITQALQQPKMMQTIASNGQDWIRAECDPVKLLNQLPLE